MGGHKSKSCTFTEPTAAPPPPPPPVYPYHVSSHYGEVCDGNYSLSGTYGGKLTYKQTSGPYYIWWDSEEDRWEISDWPGSLPLSRWEKDYDPITGTYEPTYSENTVQVVAGSAP